MLVFSLINALALVYVSPASALPPTTRRTSRLCCPVGDNACKKKHSDWKICPWTIPVINPDGSTTGGPLMPSETIRELNTLINRGNASVEVYLLGAYASAQQENFTEAETRYLQALKLTESTNNLEEQAVAHQGLGGVYARMGKPDLASSHLRNAGALYKTLGNAQGSSEVQLQLRQIQLQRR